MLHVLWCVDVVCAVCGMCIMFVWYVVDFVLCIVLCVVLRPGAGCVGSSKSISVRLLASNTTCFLLLGLRGFRRFGKRLFQPI